MKNTKKIAAWKVATVKLWLEQKSNFPNRNIDWTGMAKEVEKIDRSCFIGVSSPGRKLADFIKRNPNAVKSIEKELRKNDSIESYVNLNVSNIGASTAHINDEDSNNESENEIVKSVDFVETKLNKDGSQTIDVEIVDDVDRNQLMDETYLLTKLGYDPIVWEIVSSSCRKGEWDAQTKEGSIEKLYSYRVNANVKKRQGSICESALLDSFIAKAKENRKPVHKRVEVVGENIAIISIADLHLGKLAWYKECGGNYDYSATCL